MSAGDYIIVVLLLAVFGALMVGVVMMGIGGNVNRRFGNKMMIARVSLQGLLLVVLALMFFIGKT